MDGYECTIVEHRRRFLLDLDAYQLAIDTALASDPVLTPMVAKAPGM